MDDPSAQFSFSDRLARENGWELEYTLRTIEEYKKFMFLICIAPHPLTPSDQVDQVWHLHLIYTESYWTDFCQHTLGQNIQHGPTKGGKQERDKYNNWYEKTLELYKAVFETEPPSDIWLPVDIRFREINFQRVNTNQNWIIPKPWFWRK